MTDSPFDWTDEQREALQRWRDKDPTERHPNDLLPTGRRSEDEGSENRGSVNRNAVTDDECAEMRRVFKAEDITIKEMSRTHFEYSRTTIAEHVFNRRCTHDVEEEAAESPMDSIDPSRFVKPEQCEEMRRGCNDGMSIPEVKDHWGVTYGQAYHHLAGRCRCEHEEPDLRGKTFEDRYGE